MLEAPQINIFVDGFSCLYAFGLFEIIPILKNENVVDDYQKQNILPQQYVVFCNIEEIAALYNIIIINY